MLNREEKIIRHREACRRYVKRMTKTTRKKRRADSLIWYYRNADVVCLRRWMARAFGRVVTIQEAREIYYGD